ncbi:hypothetical protein B1R94_14215 [Mycolicibacterium litorale]|nr:hypothetical protein B1R94_14215 [Mycolicibacterium litorale]
MNLTAQSTRRVAFVVGAAAMLAMTGIGIAHTITHNGPDVGLHPIATSVGHPLAPGPNGGEVTRGNESGSFAPTSTNDLITPWTPVPGSPWRD